MGGKRVKEGLNVGGKRVGRIDEYKGVGGSSSCKMQAKSQNRVGGVPGGDR